MFPRSLTPREFNSYGARRGNDAVMTRGTFASTKLQNRFIGKPGPKTLHIPSGQTVSVDSLGAGTPGVITELESNFLRLWQTPVVHKVAVKVLRLTFELLHCQPLRGLLLITRPPPVCLSLMSLRQLIATRETAPPSSSWQGKTTALETPETG